MSILFDVFSAPRCTDRKTPYNSGQYFDTGNFLVWPWAGSRTQDVDI